jgi:hypothetical protein
VKINEKNSDLLLLKKIVREYDGTKNNEQNPQWGSTFQGLLRKSKPSYADGFS